MKLFPRIHRRDVVRTSQRKAGIAANLRGIPRHVFAGIAGNNLAAVPGHAENFGGRARGSGVRKCPQVARAAVDVELAVRLDQDQSIKACTACPVNCYAHPDPNRLAPFSLAAESLFLRPVEAGSALIQRFRQIRARDRTLFWADLAIVIRRIQAANRYPVDAELARRLVDERLDCHHNLIRPGTPLGATRRGVGQD